MLINVNGQIMAGEKPSLRHTNRAFRYGDSLFESMRMIQGKILFLEDHLSRVLEGAITMGMCPRGAQAQAYSMLQDEIKRLLKQLPGRLHCRVRLQLFRNDGGRYEPSNIGFGFLIETTPVEQATYMLNSKGLEVDIYEEMHKHSDIVSGYKTGSSLLYVMASLHKKQRRLDDCIILNPNGRPVEFTSSNLFLVNEGVIRTPPVSEGCIAGIMRKNLLEFLSKDGYQIIPDPITIEDLHSADEMFRCNMGQGIQWVGKFRDRTYSNRETTEIFTRFQVHMDTFLYFGL